jgi:ADP-ribose pyrophosphatase YjhB (NUDIX family)
VSRREAVAALPRELAEETGLSLRDLGLAAEYSEPAIQMCTTRMARRVQFLTCLLTGGRGR